MKESIKLYIAKHLAEIKKASSFYFSDKYNLTKIDCINNLAEKIEIKRKFDLKQIPPRHIIGTGYKNPRKIANEWLINQIALYYYLVENFDTENKFTPNQLKEKV